MNIMKKMQPGDLYNKEKAKLEKKKSEVMAKRQAKIEKFQSMQAENFRKLTPTPKKKVAVMGLV